MENTNFNTIKIAELGPALQKRLAPFAGSTTLVFLHKNPLAKKANGQYKVAFSCEGDPYRNSFAATWLLVEF